ncbi:MAG: hypothetical protein WD512_04365 [Candidatus Paceibacterota bacterium]
MTTYDEIWELFLTNCKTTDINLPQSEDKIKKTINSAVMLMNNQIRSEIVCDDVGETLSLFSEGLDEDKRLILSQFIRLVFLKNELSYFVTMFQPFQKDIGVRNFATQLRVLESSVTNQEEDIISIINNTKEDYL